MTHIKTRTKILVWLCYNAIVSPNPNICLINVKYVNVSEMFYFKNFVCQKKFCMSITQSG